MAEDESLELSAETLKALTEFYNEQEERDLKRKELESGQIPDQFEEDWNKSQFWYDEATTKRLADVCLQVENQADGIACISCPTLFNELHQRKIDHEKILLEFDTKFGVFGKEFAFYDFRSPLDIPKECREKYSLIIADPPYLSEDCLTKTALTIKFMAKPNARIILCTGAIMEELARKLLDVVPSRLVIKHNKELSNPFVCYTNFPINK